MNIARRLVDHVAVDLAIQSLPNLAIGQLLRTPRHGQIGPGIQPARINVGVAARSILDPDRAVGAKRDELGASVVGRENRGTQHKHCSENSSQHGKSPSVKRGVVKPLCHLIRRDRWL